MLKKEDRDWLQAVALEVREIEKRGQQWHSIKGVVLYLFAALAVLGIGGSVFGDSEIGVGGATLALIGALSLGGYYGHRKNQEERYSGRLKLIRDSLEQRGLSIAYDGSTVSDGKTHYDPMLSKSYE
jgi:hypothetical protein